MRAAVQSFVSPSDDGDHFNWAVRPSKGPAWVRRITLAKGEAVSYVAAFEAAARAEGQCLAALWEAVSSWETARIYGDPPRAAFRETLEEILDI